MFSIPVKQNFFKTLKANKARHYLSKQAFLSRPTSAVCATAILFTCDALRERLLRGPPFFLWTIISFGSRPSSTTSPPPGTGKGKLYSRHREAVLGIHDIFLWIRIRKFIPLTNESGSDPAFSSVTFNFKKATEKVFFP
jgi:hypothetical protein